MRNLLENKMFKVFIGMILLIVLIIVIVILFINKKNKTLTEQDLINGATLY